MNIFQSIILGIVQGLTEFLPISSSAHLVLVPYLLGWKFPLEETFVFNVLVQLGTLLAVVVYFRKDLANILTSFFRCLVQKKPFEEENARLGWYIILATIPAGLFGILIKEQVEQAFASPIATALFLLVTAGLLMIAERIGKQNRSLGEINWKDALWIGIAQAVSIFPGISRSGSTITGGMLRDLERPAAARFSFFMAVPVFLAAGLLAGLDLVALPDLAPFLPLLIVGFLSSAVTGFFTIHWLLKYLSSRSLLVFAIYCVIVSVLIFVVQFV